MKKFFVCTVVFVTLFHINSLAQKPFMKYGKVSEQEMTMTEYAQDTSAGAVILGDYGVTRFSFSADNGFYQTFTRHVRLKILDKTELDWADFTIRLYESDSGEDEDLSMLRGQTFNMEDGKEVKVGGWVEPGSLTYSEDGATMVFTVTSFPGIDDVYLDIRPGSHAGPAYMSRASMIYFAEDEASAGTQTGGPGPRRGSAP